MFVILKKQLLNVLAIIKLSVTNLFLSLSMMLLVCKPLSEKKSFYFFPKPFAVIQVFHVEIAKIFLLSFCEKFSLEILLSFCEKFSTEILLSFCEKFSTEILLFFCEKFSTEILLSLCEKFSTEILLSFCEKFSTEILLSFSEKFSLEILLCLCEKFSTEILLSFCSLPCFLNFHFLERYFSTQILSLWLFEEL